MTSITPLTITGSTWSTFGTLATRTNELITKVNALGDSSSVTITGGAINNTSIGATTPSTGVFTTLEVIDQADLRGSIVLVDDGAFEASAIYGGNLVVDNIQSDYVILNNTPTIDTHATTKAYVDAADVDLKNELIAYSLIFGG